jgi:hypothetical protein
MNSPTNLNWWIRESRVDLHFQWCKYHLCRQLIFEARVDKHPCQPILKHLDTSWNLWKFRRKDSERRLRTTLMSCVFPMGFFVPQPSAALFQLQEVGHQCLHRDAPGGGFWGALPGVVSSDPRRAWAGGDPVAGGSSGTSAILFGQDLGPRGALAPFFDVFWVVLWCVMLGF